MRDQKPFVSVLCVSCTLCVQNRADSAVLPNAEPLKVNGCSNNSSGMLHKYTNESVLHLTPQEGPNLLSEELVTVTAA